METRSLKYCTSILFLISLILLMIFQGCATPRRAKKGNERPTLAPSPVVPPLAPSAETYGPPVPAQEPTVGPEPIEVHPIVLVLGPGGYRSFAYAGVIRGLVDSKIPIGAIIATDMGSYLGALYAWSGNINQFEWEIQKVKGEHLSQKPRFFSNSRAPLIQAEALDDQLRSQFGNKNISDSKVPIYIGFQSSQSNQLDFQSQGSAVQLIKAAMGPMSSPQNLKTNQVALQSLIRKAQSLGIGPVVVVDVMNLLRENSGISPIGSHFDLLLKPDMNGIGVMEYQKKTESIFRGKNSVFKNVPALQQVIHSRSTVQ